MEWVSIAISQDWRTPIDGPVKLVTQEGVQQDINSGTVPEFMSQVKSNRKI